MVRTQQAISLFAVVTALMAGAAAGAGSPEIRGYAPAGEATALPNPEAAGSESPAPPAVAPAPGEPARTEPPPEEPDPLADLGFAVTSGAAPGYVEDRACRLCHSDIWRSYQEVGMAKSFYRPSPETVIEDFEENRVYHEPTRRYYEMELADGRYLFRRFQLDAAGEPINVFETEVDWILGSGHHSRTYLYQTPLGELYQLPLAWYSQTGKWAMAPGFELPRHFGVARLVRRECMFCHNAYPDVPAGSDDHWALHIYPQQLPEGTGCQRCHGPGAEHVRTVLGGELDEEAIHATIVNPGRLAPQLRNDVCYECHMQPSVALFGVRQLDRGDYSFRPGEPLPDYVLKMDVVEEGRDRRERFEINHHPYRLEQSRCFQASRGRPDALSCLTCHDPHRKVPPAERAAHYRAACLGCHELEQCDRQHMSPEEAAAYPGVDPGDCTACHMPERRTQDVVEVTMTDHLIRRRPGGPELLAPRQQEIPVIVDADFQDPERAPQGALGDIYRAIAVLRVGGGAAVRDHLARALARVQPPQPGPYLDLARAQLNEQRPVEAEATLGSVLRRAPDHPRALEWLGVALAAQGRIGEAVAALRRAVELEPRQPEAHFNLGQLLLAGEEPEDGVSHLERAVELRPNLAAAWQRLGDAHRALGRPADAIASYRRALEIEPSLGRAYAGLGRVLLVRGERAEALRTLRHGLEVAAGADEVRAVLAEAEAAAAAGDR